MSQQTTIKAVLPYYDKFLKRFPTVEDLAAASLEEVFEMWAGLGYYRRARFLHKTAQTVADNGFPKTYEGLLKLPGVGSYTAAAVASIAFSESVAVIDGNVERVICRHDAIKKDPSKGEAKKTLKKLAQKYIKGTQPGQHNQAMMELGSLICRPGELARCDDCPIHKSCKAKAKGLVASLPAKAPRPKIKPRLDRAIAIFEERRILYGERFKDQVWGGLLELPRVTIDKPEDIDKSVRRIGRQLLGRNAQWLGLGPICKVRHGVMNERITLEVYAATLKSEPKAKGYASLRWLSAKDIESAALPSPQKKAAKPCFSWWQDRKQGELFSAE